MLRSSTEQIEGRVPEHAAVLDLGGWANPLPRADWVIDLMPYETRGLYGELDPARERFTAETWIRRDLCDRDPYPFADKEIDFVVCSHTLEDIRDPIWVCSEMNRIARAGYIEVPSRLDEQSHRVHGPWVGWSHHRWLIDAGDGRIEFVAKPHSIHFEESWRLPPEYHATLSPEALVETLWWEGGFEYAERVMGSREELDEYLSSFVAARLASWSPPRGRRPRLPLGRRRAG